LSKYGQEQLLQAVSRSENVPLVMLRLGYVYGPGIDPTRAIVKLLEMVREGRPITLTNSRTAGLQLIHVDDIARVSEALLTQGEGAYNLTSPRHISLGEYVDACMRVLGRTVEVTTHDDPAAPVTNHYSTRRLLERHGLQPTVSLSEGVASLAPTLADVGARG
jgi:UDP-glucose 4-epimerase/UDP-glucuronate 4-epimerase